MSYEYYIVPIHGSFFIIPYEKALETSSASKCPETYPEYVKRQINQLKTENKRIIAVLCSSESPIVYPTHYEYCTIGTFTILYADKARCARDEREYPIELQRKLLFHHLADKKSVVVCKHGDPENTVQNVFEMAEKNGFIVETYEPYYLLYKNEQN